MTGGLVADGGALSKPLVCLRQSVGSASFTVGFQAGLPEGGGRTVFPPSLHRTARELFVTSFSLDSCGLILLEQLAWIREALDSWGGDGTAKFR